MTNTKTAAQPQTAIDPKEASRAEHTKLGIPFTAPVLADFDSVLDRCARTFDQVRYSYEGQSANWIASGIREAARQHILSLHPAWEHEHYGLVNGPLMHPN